MSIPDIIPREESFTETVDTSGAGHKAVEEFVENLQARIVGQSRAVSMVGEKLKTYFAHMNDPQMPAAVLFCLGPTGTGKSELAKEIARLWIADTLEAPLTSIECETHVHGHEIANLVGAPQGYIGYDSRPLLQQGKIDRFHFWHKNKDELGKLAEKKFKDKAEKTQAEAEIYLRNAPYRSVLLFDEIEKGSYSLWQILLHITGEAKLKMMNGEETSFRHSIVIITSNIGARGINDLLEGKGKIGLRVPEVAKESDEDALDQEIYERAKEELERRLPPELMGRLRHDIVVFRRLKREDYRKILEIQLMRVQNRIIERRANKTPIFLRYTERFKEFLLDKGIDPRFGARPLKARIQHYILGPLSGALLGKEIRQGEAVLFDVRDNVPVLLRVKRQAKRIILPTQAVPDETELDWDDIEEETDK